MGGSFGNKLPVHNTFKCIIIHESSHRDNHLESAA